MLPSLCVGDSIIRKRILSELNLTLTHVTRLMSEYSLNNYFGKVINRKLRYPKFCSDNILTQLIESPTHKDGNILDLLLCNYGFRQS